MKTVTVTIKKPRQAASLLTGMFSGESYDQHPKLIKFILAGTDGNSVVRILHLLPVRKAKQAVLDHWKQIHGVTAMYGLPSFGKSARYSPVRTLLIQKMLRMPIRIWLVIGTSKEFPSPTWAKDVFEPHEVDLMVETVHASSSPEFAYRLSNMQVEGGIMSGQRWISDCQYSPLLNDTQKERLRSLASRYTPPPGRLQGEE